MGTLTIPVRPSFTSIMYPPAPSEIPYQILIGRSRSRWVSFEPQALLMPRYVDPDIPYIELDIAIPVFVIIPLTLLYTPLAASLNCPWTRPSRGSLSMVSVPLLTFVIKPDGFPIISCDPST